MSIIRLLGSALVVSGALALAACGGGGAGVATTAPLSTDDDPDAALLDGREGIPRVEAPAGSEAHVEVVRRSGHKSDDRFRVDAIGMPIGAVIDVWLEDPSSPGTLTIVGTFVIGADGSGELLRSTWNGDSLPYDVQNVIKLVGGVIELRAPAGTLLFAGTVPPLN